MKEKICKFCGESFIPNSNFQKYCKRPHYMNCPVCRKRYLVTNNENLKRPPVACSYECRIKRTQETSLKKYGVLAPGNNLEAREKAKATSRSHYGVDYGFQSDEVQQKIKQTLLDKYGVDNIMKSKEFQDKAAKSSMNRWKATVHSKLPYKFKGNQNTADVLEISEDNMQVYILKEKVSQEFLKKNGHVINPRFRRTQLSIGLVKEQSIYQVLRFEKDKDTIRLTNFGTRTNYFNPNYYDKLMNTAIEVIGVDEFVCTIPRSIVDDKLLKSLSVELVTRGDYIPYWIVGEELKPVARKDNIDQMLKKYDYMTTDYLDNYQYHSER